MEVIRGRNPIEVTNLAMNLANRSGMLSARNMGVFWVKAKLLAES